MLFWSILTSKKDLSSVFFGGPGVGGACDTDITSAKSKKHIVNIKSKICTVTFKMIKVWFEINSTCSIIFSLAQLTLVYIQTPHLYIPCSVSPPWRHSSATGALSSPVRTSAASTPWAMRLACTGNPRVFCSPPRWTRTARNTAGLSSASRLHLWNNHRWLNILGLCEYLIFTPGQIKSSFIKNQHSSIFWIEFWEQAYKQLFLVKVVLQQTNSKHTDSCSKASQNIANTLIGWFAGNLLELTELVSPPLLVSVALSATALYLVQFLATDSIHFSWQL